MQIKPLGVKLCFLIGHMTTIGVASLVGHAQLIFVSVSQDLWVNDAGEQQKTLFKISQSIFIDTDSLMRALHFYFMYQLIQKRANFRLYF